MKLRAKLADERRTGGRGLISRPERLRIRGRLRTLLKQTGLTQAAVANALGVSRNTLVSWTSTIPESLPGRRLPVPETAQLLAIADELHIQPTFVLTGRGPERMGASLSDENIAQLLHAYLKGVLADELKATPEFVEWALPSSAALLSDVLQSYRGVLTEAVRQQREWNFRRSLLGRALAVGHRKGLSVEQQAMQASLLEWTAREDRKRETAPPVDPPGRPESRSPLVGPGLQVT